MRKTLAAVVFGTSLLTASCASKDAKMASGKEQTVASAAEAQRNMGSGVTVGYVDSALAAVPAAKADMGGGEAYKDYGKNPWVDAAKDRLSTFAADVDTASYTLARRKLLEGALPTKAGVRWRRSVPNNISARPMRSAASRRAPTT